MEKDSKELQTTLNRTFRKDLEPIFEMLEQKEKILSNKDWKALVDETKDRIIAAPEQYLSQVRMPSVLITRMIESIFDDGLN